MNEIIAILIPLLIQVESAGNPLAQGDFRDGKPMAIGCLQIWPDYWTDGTQELKVDWDYQNAYKPAMAIAVTKAYLTRYGRNYRRQTGSDPSMEVLARIHNGGPQGWNPKHTKKYIKTTHYWKKVLKAQKLQKKDE